MDNAPKPLCDTCLHFKNAHSRCVRFAETLTCDDKPLFLCEGYAPLLGYMPSQQKDKISKKKKRSKKQQTFS